MASSQCLIAGRRKSSLSVSVSMVENRRRWKTSVKVSALRGNVFDNCRTLRWPSCAAPSARERIRWTQRTQSKLEEKHEQNHRSKLFPGGRRTDQREAMHLDNR